MNPFTLFMKAAMDAMIRPDSTKPSFHKLLYKIWICKSEYCRSLQELSFTIPVTGNARRNPSVINAGIQLCPLDIVFRCLEENILHKIEQQQKVIVYKEKVSAKRKLLTYSMKVMVAAAAAIAFLIVVPTVEQQSRPNMETYVAEAKEQVNKDLQEQKEKAKKRSEEQNFLQRVNDASSAFCDFITETTNGWFLKEER